MTLVAFKSPAQDESVSAAVFLNPMARDAKGQKYFDEIITTLREHYPDLHIIQEPLPNTEERHEKWRELLQTLKPKKIFIGGGDGTITEVISVLMNLDAKPIRTAADMAELSIPHWLEEICGIPIGSAQDMHKLVEFPTVQGLRHYLDHPEEQAGFDFSIVTLLNNANPFEPKESGHSTTAGFSAEIWKALDDEREVWRAKSGNQNREIPFWYSSLFGRFRCFVKLFLSGILRDSADAVSPFLPVKPNLGNWGKEFKSLSIEMQRNDEDPVIIHDATDFALFSLMMAAGFCAIPEVFPVAGEDFGILAGVIPKSPFMVPSLLIEASARIFAAKHLGMLDAIGQESKFYTVKVLQELGLWHPNSLLTLKHGDRLSVKFFERTNKDGQPVLEPCKARVLINGDLVEAEHHLRFAIGETHHTIPLKGSTNSLLARRSVNHFNRQDKREIAQLCSNLARQGRFSAIRDLGHMTPQHWRAYRSRQESLAIAAK